MNPSTDSGRIRGKNAFVTRALDGFRFFGSSTPEAFAAKSTHVDPSAFAVVFVDVLRATTTLNAAIAAGCCGISLVVKPQSGDYNSAPPVFSTERWIVGGEENGRPIPGGSIDNSPGSILNTAIDGAFLKFFSTNGATAFDGIISKTPGAVFLMSMANVEATIDALMSAGYDRIWFVCGGFYYSASLEDMVCCGRAIRYLVTAYGVAHHSLDDEARMMLICADSLANDDELIEALNACQVAKLLVELGKASDLVAAIRGTAIESLWGKMKDTVVQLKSISSVPILTRLATAPRPTRHALAN